ncbi:MAG TPA: trehalose-binding protein [Syntrophobacteraceae bacterium]|nr:trehalose-binding protein [Syntrophobacteraceae bacterium]
MQIGGYSYEEYLRAVASFHGNVAPGVVLGGFMVELATQSLPDGVLYDAISETSACLPDAIQLLTPCTVGNGWLRVINLGRYALSLYDKYQGNGVRVFVDAKKVQAWPEITTWLYKSKPKKEQDKERLLNEIGKAGFTILSSQSVQVRSRYLGKHSRGSISICPLCEEPYPAQDGGICRACQGELPYEPGEDMGRVPFQHDARGAQTRSPSIHDGMKVVDDTLRAPHLQVVSVKDAVGRHTLHDMTEIIPGQSKGPAFRAGHEISVGDLCRLQQMGRERVYIVSESSQDPRWVHENEAALAFAQAMAGEGVSFQGPPREGKIELVADRDGVLVVDEERLERFNLIPGVMCASRRSFTVVSHGRGLAGTRAIPLFLPRNEFNKAMTVLADGPVFQVIAMQPAWVGILVTGSEIFKGLVEDKFIPIIKTKVEQFPCEVVQALIVPDDRRAIRDGIRELIDAGADLLVTTAGLSVDPDDVTRQGLVDAGATDMLYGAPILPGAMTLLARIRSIPIIGVPACALYFKSTSFDLLLPRLLARLPITRRDLARMGHGGYCLACKSCTFPKCPFGR